MRDMDDVNDIGELIEDFIDLLLDMREVAYVYVMGS